MEDQPHPALVAALVEAIDGRTLHQSAWILQVLEGGSWPGGTADRSSPAAAEWVRRWDPDGTGPSYSANCSCSAGRCAVCN
jgi:hypothetical protein